MYMLAQIWKPEHLYIRAVNVYPGSRLTKGWYLNGS